MRYLTQIFFGMQEEDAISKKLEHAKGADDTRNTRIMIIRLGNNSSKVFPSFNFASTCLISSDVLKSKAQCISIFLFQFQASSRCI